jgi:hypothetical protein
MLKIYEICYYDVVTFRLNNFCGTEPIRSYFVVDISTTPFSDMKVDLNFLSSFLVNSTFLLAREESFGPDFYMKCFDPKTGKVFAVSTSIVSDLTAISSERLSQFEAWWNHICGIQSPINIHKQWKIFCEQEDKYRNLDGHFFIDNFPFMKLYHELMNKFVIWNPTGYEFQVVDFDPIKRMFKLSCSYTYMYVTMEQLQIDFKLKN